MGRGLAWRLGFVKPGLQARLHPISIDIGWGAAMFEGEGGVFRGRPGSITVHITQKDRWVLRRLRDLFGGSISKYPTFSRWVISGARSRGFLMTIYKFLSPRRKRQVRKVLRQDGIASA